MLTLLLTLACITDKWVPKDSGDPTGDSDVSSDSDPATDSGPTTDSAEPQEKTGEELYILYCASCHGADGSGTPNGPPVTGELHHSDEELVRFMLEGKKDMEPVEGLSEEDAYTIAAWMREQWG